MVYLLVASLLHLLSIPAPYEPGKPQAYPLHWVSVAPRALFDTTCKDILNRLVQCSFLLFWTETSCNKCQFILESDKPIEKIIGLILK